MIYPRVLVVSNQSFSDSTSNGRTLGTLFKGWPHDKLRQFCISLNNPDTSVCTDYFAVSDSEALKSFLSLGLNQDKDNSVTLGSNPKNNRSQGLNKTAIVVSVRNIVWSTGLWKSSKFREWLDDFKPQIVVFQSGDSAFMADIARNIAKKYGARIVIFNTEGYIFFNHNYLKHHYSDFIAFPIFKRVYRKAFFKVFKSSTLSIYLNSQLESDYQKLLAHKSEVIYNSSEITFRPAGELSDTPTFAYLGNLGLKRPEALAEFAEVLREVAPACHIDVYGKLPADYDGIFDRTPGIVYHGMVSYDKVKEVIGSTDFLLHVEKDDPVLTRALRYAFSTKIADSICSGRNFIVYAPASLACSKYIADTGAAWLASTKTELRQVLETVLTDREARSKVLSRAREVAEENHSAAKNSAKFQEILCSISKDQ